MVIGRLHDHAVDYCMVKNFSLKLTICDHKSSVKIDTLIYLDNGDALADKRA